MPCAGTEGGGPEAIEVVIDGQNFQGYPTYCVVCPDHTLFFDPCYPPTVTGFDPYFEECASSVLSASFAADKTNICAGHTIQFYDESSGNVTSWDWVFPGGDPGTSTEQNPVVTYNDAGYWDVTLTVSDGTEFSTRAIEGFIYADPCTGIDETNINDFKVYPNPTTGELNLVLNHIGVVTIDVLNILGKSVYNQELMSNGESSFNVDISGFEDGLYFVKVQMGDNTLVRKIKLIK
jgi:PKD repeat protein